MKQSPGFLSEQITPIPMVIQYFPWPQICEYLRLW